MYTLDDYLAMVEDPLRTPAYLEAMARTIRQGDRVLEIGTGFGFFAVHACRLGAAHVVAVEPNDAIAHGRALAAANGCADRITFVQSTSGRLTLAERASVLVEDLRGTSPLHGARLAVLRDARARLLAPGARQVPRADALWVAPAELPGDLRRLAPDHAAVVHGIDLAPVRAVAWQDLHRTTAGPDVLLGEGACWARIDLTTADDTEVVGQVSHRIVRDGALAGLVSWFVADLAEGVGFSTGPSSGRSVYDRAFLPVGAALPVRAGDEVRVRLRARHDGVEYLWLWEVEVVHADGGREGRRCSNLATRAMSAARRARREAGRLVPRTPAIDQVAALLGRIDGTRTLGDLAAELHAADAVAFADERAALRWAAELLARLDEDPIP